MEAISLSLSFSANCTFCTSFDTLVLKHSVSSVQIATGTPLAKNSCTGCSQLARAVVHRFDVKHTSIGIPSSRTLLSCSLVKQMKWPILSGANSSTSSFSFTDSGSSPACTVIFNPILRNFSSTPLYSLKWLTPGCPQRSTPTKRGTLFCFSILYVFSASSRPFARSIDTIKFTSMLCFSSSITAAMVCKQSSWSKSAPFFGVARSSKYFTPSSRKSAMISLATRRTLSRFKLIELMIVKSLKTPWRLLSSKNAKSVSFPSLS